MQGKYIFFINCLMPSICLLVALVHLPMHGGEIWKRKEKSNYLLEQLLFVTMFFQCFLFLSVLKSLSCYQICVFSLLVMMILFFQIDGLFLTFSEKKKVPK